jgi:ribosomal protein L7/L12
MAMPELDELVGLHRDGKSSGEILTAMKERGLTITEAIKASMQLFGIGLGEAKSLVASHPSWNRTAEAAKPFQDELIRAFREAGSVGTQPE